MSNLPNSPPDLTPLVNLATETYAKGVSIVNTVVDKASSLNEDARDNLASALTKIDEFLRNLDSRVNNTLDKIKDIYTAAPDPQKPAPSIDVVESMNQIALAIQKAEDVLNKQNLVIVNGSVEAELNVAIFKSGPGAHATIKINISQKPYA